MKNQHELLISKIKFNDQDLVPVVTQDYLSKDVLMLAWMNKEAIINTIETGQVCYWSRSRNKLWFKGETSNQIQYLKSFILDCDCDTILLQIEQIGVSCHTGRKSCFYISYESDGSFKNNQEIQVSPTDLYNNS